MTIGYPPSWSKDGDKIVWDSQPVTGNWYASITRLGNDAHATQPIGWFTDADIIDVSDIYVTKDGIQRVYRVQTSIDFADFIG
ncbi:hypothetical protein [Cohnella zeiphila]|uniref:Uncharacterized protein n=1 Tax=Cohnella zeiphila TaxID=2761120 RepID=A0A7X0SKF2_9BACL|nr:hypothetical protein [Cohnella zeiphila]MBB6731501.1 hypothetical protein [Cohnella zeiphila]